MAKKVDLKNNTVADLDKLVAEKREELRALRFNVAGSKTRDVKQSVKLRREIARILTVRTATAKAAK